MNRLLLAAASLLALTLAVPVQAREARDARLASRAYDANEVVRVDGRAGVQAAIAFADDEQIENVAIGDAASWQVTPNKRATMLFIKPLAANARTNLTVVTDQRSYFFDLVASPKSQPLYVLRFTYPEKAGSKRGGTPSPHRQAATGSTAAEELALAGLPADPPGDRDAAVVPTPAPVDLAAPKRDPAALNFAWESKGKRKLLPSRVYDDGNSTYLTWTEGTAMPAILVRDGRGAEGPVNFAVRDDVIVVEGVPRLLVLRSGRDEATLENRREGTRSRREPAAAAAASTVPAVNIAPDPTDPPTTMVAAAESSHSPAPQEN